MVFHIDAGNIERIRRKIRRIDVRLGEYAGGENGEAAGTRAEIQNARDLRHILDQRSVLAAEESGAHQFADIGAWHDDPLIDIEGHPMDIGAPHQVSRGHAGFDAPADHFRHGLPFAVQKLRVKPRVDVVDRQVQRLEDQEGRLVGGG